ncbi:proton glutamate symport protein [Betaproteobacteria bacterium]|nr:proton glutamate symport protein [Betaproteobacteria bacterium]
MMKSKKCELTTQIFIGLILGVIFGYLFPEFALSLKPIGDIFLRMIKMIVVPLVFSALIVGIAGTGDFKQLGRLGFKTILWFEFATTIALIVGVLAVNILKPGEGVSVADIGDTSAVAAAARKSIDMLQMLIDIVPTNIVDAMSRGSLLQIVFFSTLFGVATAAAGKHGEPVLKVADSVMQIMFHFTMYVMRLAPVGVFATISFTVGKFGLAMLLPLAKLILALYAALLFFILIVLFGAAVVFRVNFFHMMRAIKEPLLLAFTTASSETALPMLIERLQKFGVPKHIVTFVLPTGYSFNLDGGTLYAALAVMFIAQVYGVPLDYGQQIMLVLTLAFATKGMAAVPGAVLITIAGTVASFGLPVEGVALILGVDRLLDMGRTATNVIGNSVATIVVARWEGALPQSVLQEAYRKDYNIRNEFNEEAA